ncbi:pilus assembly protein PilX [Acinetobacter schindleri]|uniref:pilus assembly PilX family protein n=1 Tax=Acinetobacter schindleri TaxID=108981 RepID=UPI00236104E4|nr:pilus assembly protein PilX [Acinetobacter schindleri]WDE16300.1 pilus assembly protein PilX [Acinetobacter schindleri]
MKNNQQGATLITILILLVAITIIGSLAIRSSITSLKISTMSQAQQLMLQSSDTALFQIENPENIQKNMAINGMFGYIKGEDNIGKELVFCYKASEPDFFKLSRASLINWNGTTVDSSGLGQNGFCKIDNGFFSSSRKTVMTQVAIKAADMSNAEAFSYMQKGTDPDSAKIDPGQLYTVYATTIFPALAPSSVSNTSIDNCFKQHFNSIPSTKIAEVDIDLATEKAKPTTGTGAQNPTTISNLELAKKTVSACLNNLGVPAHTQVATYSLQQNLIK